MILSYARVSANEQSDGTSLAEQLRKGRALASLRGADAYSVMDFIDDAVSGSIPLAMRPAGKDMVSIAASGDIIVAAKLDRLFRSASDALTTVEALKARNIDVILLDMGTDPVTSSGPAKLFFTMLSAFAEFERTRIHERCSDGRRAKKERGGHIAGSAPYGTRIVGSGKLARLEEIPEEQKVILQIFKLGQLLKTSEIAKELNKLGVKPRAGTRWQDIQICRIMDRNRENILVIKKKVEATSEMSLG